MQAQDVSYEEQSITQVPNSAKSLAMLLTSFNNPAAGFQLPGPARNSALKSSHGNVAQPRTAVAMNFQAYMNPNVNLGMRHQDVFMAEEGASDSAEETEEEKADEPKKKEKKKRTKVAKEKIKEPKKGQYAPPPMERTFYMGPPSITETFIPGVSIFTVIGIIPFGASIARQAWTRYEVTNRRIKVKSGFRGQDSVQIVYREITDLKWLRRWGGSAGDLVFSLLDGSKVEVRSMPDFERILAFVMNTLGDEFKLKCGYPDKDSKEYLDKVARGEAKKPEFEDEKTEEKKEDTVPR